MMKVMRQVSPLKAAGEGVADPRETQNVRLLCSLLNSKTGGPGKAGPESQRSLEEANKPCLAGYRVSVPLCCSECVRSDLQDFINHNCFSFERRD